MKRIHIDENVNIRTNEEADIAFSKENDRVYYDPEKGVAKVPKERWEKAQRTEWKHWMNLGINSKDDRNFYHLDKFNNYQALNGLSFKHALEVGCGPFTNLRIIGNFCKIQKCSLNDPLINNYLEHTNCFYNRSHLVLDNNETSAFKKLYNKLSRKKISIDKLYASAFEEIQTDTKFDLIVIINVIEHCYDIDLFFNKLLDLLSDDGVLIFEDKLYDVEKTKEDIQVVYDAAHPLRVNKDLILTFLAKNFNEKYRVIEPNKMELEGNTFEWEEIYYIGKKAKAYMPNLL